MKRGVKKQGGDGGVLVVGRQAVAVVRVIHLAVGAAAAAADHRVVATAVAPEVVAGETREEGVTALAVHHPARRGLALDLPTRVTHGRGTKISPSVQDHIHLNLIVDRLVTSNLTHLLDLIKITQTLIVIE
jgi:hypothetical protein